MHCTQVNYKKREKNKKVQSHVFMCPPPILSNFASLFRISPQVFMSMAQTGVTVAIVCMWVQCIDADLFRVGRVAKGHTSPDSFRVDKHP